MSKFDKILTSGQPIASYVKPSLVLPRKGKVRQVDYASSSPCQFLEGVLATINPGGKKVAWTEDRIFRMKRALVMYMEIFRSYMTGGDVSEDLYKLKKMLSQIDPDAAFSGTTIINETLVRWLSNVHKELTK
jgi:hypothetical protein